jgi:hypothetical protein
MNALALSAAPAPAQAHSPTFSTKYLRKNYNIFLVQQDINVFLKTIITGTKKGIVNIH